MKDSIILKIVELEWKMFIEVSNIGGTASCQEDYKTFKIMRTSQFLTWSEDTLKSYLDDLITASENGRNLMTEKYARMMEYTSPHEFASLAHVLPDLDKESLDIINEIVKIILEWEKDLSEKFPFIRARGRPTHSYDDKQDRTSIETYLRGELATYSHKTLKLYLEHILWQKSKNINASENNLLNMVKEHGWKSLEAANEELKSNNNINK